MTGSTIRTEQLGRIPLRTSDHRQSHGIILVSTLIIASKLSYQKSRTDNYPSDAQDSPPTKCNLQYPADCSAQGKNGCIITAISTQSAAFLNPSTDDTARREALMFIMHLIGDLHQPLHVEDAYRGGNEIPVCFAKKCANNNLHAVWDKDIPHKICGLRSSPTHDEEKAAASDWADKLVSLNAANGVDASAECADISNPSACSLAWARESNTWVCKFAMAKSVDYLEKTDLSKDYYEGAVPVVEELIAKAGARLGGWLNALAAGAQANGVRYGGQRVGDQAVLKEDKLDL